MLTPEQLARRRGMLTASNAAVIMGNLTTDGLSKYTRQLAGERLYGDLGEEGYHSKAMDRGGEEENGALDFYEFESGLTIVRQPFVMHPTIPNVAATPDGLVEGRHTVEAKCPLFHVWCETREAWKTGRRGLDAVPSQYRWQCRWQVWCCGLTHGVFVAYHPAGGGQGVIVPYEVTESEMAQMAERVVKVEALIRNWLDILQD